MTFTPVELPMLTTENSAQMINSALKYFQTRFCPLLVERDRGRLQEPHFVRAAQLRKRIHEIRSAEKVIICHFNRSTHNCSN